MQDAAWLKGMAELSLLPEREETPERKAIRGITYRRELGGLSDELFLGACSLAIQRLKWFPPVATMLEYAKELHEAPPAKVLAYLPAANVECADCRGSRWAIYERSGHAWAYRCMCPPSSLTHVRYVSVDEGKKIFSRELVRLGIVDHLPAVKAIESDPPRERQPGEDDE